MKKSIFTIIAVFAITTFSFAQNGAFNNGDKLLNIGIGVNSHYSGGIPVGASLEFGITDDISVGANVDYLSHKYSDGFKFTAVYFGARANYHFNEVLNINNDNVDVYGGLTLGYRSFSWKDSGFDDILGKSYGSQMYFGAQIGGKYYFSDNVGGFIELGELGSTNARVGVAFKF